MQHIPMVEAMSNPGGGNTQIVAAHNTDDHMAADQVGTLFAEEVQSSVHTERKDNDVAGIQTR